MIDFWIKHKYWYRIVCCIIYICNCSIPIDNISVSVASGKKKQFLLLRWLHWFLGHISVAFSGSPRCRWTGGQVGSYSINTRFANHVILWMICNWLLFLAPCDDGRGRLWRWLLYTQQTTWAILFRFWLNTVTKSNHMSRLHLKMLVSGPGTACAAHTIGCAW